MVSFYPIPSGLCCSLFSFVVVHSTGLPHETKTVLSVLWQCGNYCVCVCRRSVTNSVLRFCIRQLKIWLTDFVSRRRCLPQKYYSLWVNWSFVFGLLPVFHTGRINTFFALCLLCLSFIISSKILKKELHSVKKLFIDYEKAYDNVNRNKLWEMMDSKVPN